jgi:hypothetical protein
MHKPVGTLSGLMCMALAAVILFAGGGCKSSRKAMSVSAVNTQQEQEAALRKQQEEEALRKKQAEEKARWEEEAARKEKEKAAPHMKLEQYFSAISGAPTVASANNSIQEALALFASEDTPVLIVISEEKGQKDYDRPTTIKAYLNYLKDQKKNTNRISNLQLDASGKITEVELSKQP